MTNLAFGILNALHERGEIHGTEKLAEILNTPTNKGVVYAQALLLAKNGLIIIEQSIGGRGHKTIYRDAGVIKVKR